MVFFNPISDGGIGATGTPTDTDGGYGGGSSWDDFLDDIVNGAIGIIGAVQDGRGGPAYPAGTQPLPAPAAGNDGLLLFVLFVAAVYFLSES